LLFDQNPKRKRTVAVLASVGAVASAVVNGGGTAGATVSQEPGDPTDFDDGIVATDSPPMPAAPPEVIVVEDGVEHPADTPEGTSVTGPYWGYPLRHYASLVPQPPGMTTNSCYYRGITNGRVYHCRMAYTWGGHIRKDSTAIKSVSAAHSTWGIQVTTSSTVYEGCKLGGKNDSLYICDFLTTNQWQRQTTTSNWNYYLDAFKKTSATVSCGLELSKFWKGTFDPGEAGRKCGGIDF
jgi:hypothetical protein